MVFVISFLHGQVESELYQSKLSRGPCSGTVNGTIVHHHPTSPLPWTMFSDVRRAGFPSNSNHLLGGKPGVYNLNISGYQAAVQPSGFHELSGTALRYSWIVTSSVKYFSAVVHGTHPPENCRTLIHANTRLIHPSWWTYLSWAGFRLLSMNRSWLRQQPPSFKAYGGARETQVQDCLYHGSASSHWKCRLTSTSTH
jgi:hypothetical protein